MGWRIALLTAAALVAAPAAAQDYNQTNAAETVNEVVTTDVNAAAPIMPANDMTTVPVAPAQDEPATAPAPRNKDFPWGLIGLVGLVGLLGRMRR